MSSRRTSSAISLDARALVLGAALAITLPVSAWACSACACGNPTLTSMGTEPPLAGRVRLATSMRAWSESETTQQLRELRFDLLASWSFSQRWSVFAAVPLQLREVTTNTLAKERGFGLGDTEVQARWVFLLDERMRPRWVLGLQAGLRLPTAPTINDSRGVALSTDAQLGSQGFVGLAGVGYSGFFSEKISAHAALQGEAPMSGRAQFGGRLYLAAQWQPWAWLGLRAGAETRAQAQREELPGGFSFFAAPDALVRLPADITLLVGGRIPLFDTRAGMRAGPMVVASVVVDL